MFSLTTGGQGPTASGRHDAVGPGPAPAAENTSRPGATRERRLANMVRVVARRWPRRPEVVQPHQHQEDRKAQSEAQKLLFPPHRPAAPGAPSGSPAARRPRRKRAEYGREPRKRGLDLLHREKRQHLAKE